MYSLQGMFYNADLSSCPKQAAAWCSFILVSRVLLLSPIYTISQLHGTSYTTPDLFFIGMGSFILTRVALRVAADTQTLLHLAVYPMENFRVKVYISSKNKIA
jgi:hypothetical protein